MKSNLMQGTHERSPADRVRTSARTLASVLIAAAALVAGCSSKTDGDTNAPPASSTPHDVTMTAEQRQHIKLYTVAPSTFRKTTETTGAVDFDNDQATSVLAPFSGPVSRLLVSPGDQVKKVNLAEAGFEPASYGL